MEERRADAARMEKDVALVVARSVWSEGDVLKVAVVLGSERERERIFTAGLQVVIFRFLGGQTFTCVWLTNFAYVF